VLDSAELDHDVTGRWLETGVEEAANGATRAPVQADRVARRAFTVLMIGALVLLGIIIQPLAGALALAAALSGVLWPLQQRLMRKLRWKRPPVAGLLVFLVVLTFITPIVALSAFAVNEASDGVDYVSETVRSEGVAGLIKRLPHPLQEVAKAGIDRLPKAPGVGIEEAVQQQVNAQGGRAAVAFGTVVAATGTFVFQAAMMLIALFFFLVLGDRVVRWLDRVSPLQHGQTRELLRDFKRVSYAVVVSTMVTSAVQAFAALMGYYLARVPHPVFFATITFFMAFVPAIGAGTVCLVAAGLLLLTGHNYAAIFLAIWGLTVVSLVDNVIKPFLIKGGMELHAGIVFFSLIGGLLAFGAVGLLIGPLIVTLFLTLLRMYRRDFQPTHRSAAGDVLPEPHG
jgi:predicted PurR-regulated permease PerM